MPQMLSGIPVEFEKQVKHILTDSAELAGYQVRDLKLHFDSSPDDLPDTMVGHRCMNL
jgi:hypothetical protein